MRISLHRALAQIKTTEARLQQLTDHNRCTDIYIAVLDKSSNTTLDGMTREAAERKILANKDQFNALYKNLLNLKRAIIHANAGIPENTELHRVSVSNDNYTLAELIVCKKILAYKEAYLALLKSRYSSATKQIAAKNMAAQARLDKMIESMSGGDKSKVSANDIQSTGEWFMKNNGCELIDPIHLAEYIEKLEKEITDFKVESDAAISQENALTTIEINLQG